MAINFRALSILSVALFCLLGAQAAQAAEICQTTIEYNPSTFDYEQVTTCEEVTDEEASDFLDSSEEHIAELGGTIEDDGNGNVIIVCTNTTTFIVTGGGTSTPPPAPATCASDGWADYVSPPNSCGMTTTCSWDCDATNCWDVSSPPDSACPAPEPTPSSEPTSEPEPSSEPAPSSEPEPSGGGSCDPNEGNSCTRTNSCSMSNTGTIQCDGSCSVSAPSNDSCPVPMTFNIQISTDRQQVKAGEQVTIIWDTNTLANVNCSIYGPNFGPITFNPSTAGVEGGSQLSAPLSSKSEYTISCVDPVSGSRDQESVVVEVAGTFEEI